MLDFTKCQSDRFAYRHNTDDPFSYFGSKTAYKTVSAKQYDAPPSKLTEKQLNININFIIVSL